MGRDSICLIKSRALLAATNTRCKWTTGTIRNAHRIICMRDGKVVECGTPKDRADAFPFEVLRDIVRRLRSQKFDLEPQNHCGHLQHFSCRYSCPGWPLRYRTVGFACVATSRLIVWDSILGFIRFYWIQAKCETLVSKHSRFQMFMFQEL